jgi:hypothetical protein
VTHPRMEIAAVAIAFGPQSLEYPDDAHAPHQNANRFSEVVVLMLPGSSRSNALHLLLSFTPLNQ